MRTLIGVAVAATSLGSAGVALAEPAISGNVAITSDYTFRGVSQTNESAAIQGGFDYTNDMWYGGVWASNVGFSGSGSTEIDLYAGLKPTFGALNTDFGVIGYFYPDASDAGAELDYGEVYAKASISPAEGFTIGGALFVSPEFTGETGTGVYAEVGAAYAFDAAFSVSGAFGEQSADDIDWEPGGSKQDSYQTWNIGASYAPQDGLFQGFTVDGRYVDTDLDDNIRPDGDGRFVVSIKKSL